MKASFVCRDGYLAGLFFRGTVLKPVLEEIGVDVVLRMVSDFSPDNLSCDVLYMIRPTQPACLSLINSARQSSTKVVVDLEDNFWNLPKDHLDVGRSGGWEAHVQRLAILQDCLDRADATVVTTVTLRSEVEQHFDGPIYMVPTVLPRSAFGSSAVAVSSGAVTFGFAGTAASANELASAHVRRAAEEVARVHSVSFQYWNSGVQVPWMQEVGSGWFDDLTAYFRKLCTLGWTVGLAPACVNAFNKAKSPLRYWTYSLMGIATIASVDTAYDVIEHGVDGLLADEHSWLEAMEYLATDRPARAKLAANALAKAQSLGTIEGQRSLISRVWQQLCGAL